MFDKLPDRELLAERLEVGCLPAIVEPSGVARQEEGHPALVVHGPLQALLMAEYAGRNYEISAACTLEYRLTAPLYLGKGLIVGGTRGDRSIDLSVRNAHGVVTARGILRDVEDRDIGLPSE